MDRRSIGNTFFVKVTAFWNNPLKDVADTKEEGRSMRGMHIVREVFAKVLSIASVCLYSVRCIQRTKEVAALLQLSVSIVLIQL